MKNDFYREAGKRCLDFLASVLLLLLLLPLIILTAFLLRITQNKKIFFIQRRIGKNDIEFRIIKFRTMSDKKDINGNLLPDADRLTSLGRMIRKTSIDELPQLFNVLKGDMSLIGPRPLLVEYLPLYSKEQRIRHHVRPGITGWAQVNGRNIISWQKKFELDQWYVKNLSFTLDLRILWLTVFNILKAKGINQDGQATIQAFKGNID